ncbi:MAG: hypothetical protein M3Y55_08135 [Pseudomonadota bacterium]|nr:hypothetical protein [Pseudomonadota bacterium]
MLLVVMLCLAHKIQDRLIDAVVLSNYVTVEMKRKCTDLGARRVFDKSKEIEDLIEFCSRLDSGEAL